MAEFLIATTAAVLFGKYLMNTAAAEAAKAAAASAAAEAAKAAAKAAAAEAAKVVGYTGGTVFAVGSLFTAAVVSGSFYLMNREPAALLDSNPPSCDKMPHLIRTCGVNSCRETKCSVTLSELEERKKTLRTKYKIDEKHVHLAFAGRTGVGKTTLINELCGGDKSSLVVSDHREGTSTVTIVDCPQNKHIKIVDLPGAGGIENTAHGYFFEKACFAYDCILIVLDCRFTEIDLEIIRGAVQWKKPWAIVRSKCDHTLREWEEESPETLAEFKTNFRNSIEAHVEKELGKIGLLNKDDRPKIFFVSKSVYTKKNPEFCMDEDNLKQWIFEVGFKERVQKKPAKCDIDTNHPITKRLFYCEPCDHTFCEGCAEKTPADRCPKCGRVSNRKELVLCEKPSP